jgi:hypothetical protein
VKNFALPHSININLFSLIYLMNTLQSPSSWLISKTFMYLTGGDGLAVNMSGQHVCVLQVRVPLPPPCGYSGV